MINAITTALSGLVASAKRVEASASNIANVQTSGSLEEGGKAPYSALTTVQSAQQGGGVRADIVQKDPAFVPAYSPDSPFADGEGYIGVPNVDLAEEAVNLKVAELTYKANLKTIETAADLQKDLLDAVDRKV